jgi:hypothetical protein
MMPRVSRVLDDPAAIGLWLALTLAGVIAAFVADGAIWAVVGWAVGGVRCTRSRQRQNTTPPGRALTYADRARFPRSPTRSATRGSGTCRTSTTAAGSTSTGPDRALIEQAAARLRHGAIRAGYLEVVH